MKGRNWETGLDVEFEFFSLPRQAQIFPLPLCECAPAEIAACLLPLPIFLDAQSSLEAGNRARTRGKGRGHPKKVVWQPERHIDKGH